MAPNDSASRFKRSFDFVSANLIEEILLRTATGSASDDSVSDTAYIDAFFQKFTLTDVLVFRPAGRPAAVDRVLENLFTSNGPVQYHKATLIEAENENQLFSLIRKERLQTDFIAVRSAEEKVVRAAAESAEADVVIPVFYAQNGANTYVSSAPINHIVAKLAREKKTAFGFELAPFLQTRGYRRSKIFADAMAMIPTLRKYKVPMTLFSGAVSLYDMRGPYELEAFGALLGLSREEAASAVSKSPAEKIDFRAKQKSGRLLMNGVEWADDSEA